MLEIIKLYKPFRAMPNFNFSYEVTPVATCKRCGGVADKAKTKHMETSGGQPTGRIRIVHFATCLTCDPPVPEYGEPVELQQ